jgi:predicted CoA-binding protein
VVDRDERVLVGAWAVAPLVGEWIHQACLAIKAGISVDTLLDSVFQFPTFSQAYSKLWRRWTFEEADTVHENPSREEIKEILEGARNVAVVGLSDDPHRTSQAIARAMQNAGYRIFPVNPNLTGPVLGEEPYATVEEIPEQVDIVDVFRRSEKVMPTAEDAVAAGAKVLWLQSGVINEEAASYAEEYGLTVVMDRCIKVEYALLVRR